MKTAVSFGEERCMAELRRGSEKALGQIIDKYTAYVGAVVWNVIGGVLSHGDAEEIISDTFMALWSNAEKVRSGKLKAYLGTIARNKARDALRKAKGGLQLEEDCIGLGPEDPEQLITEREERQALYRALDLLGEPDRSIFISHYFYCRSTAKIADELGMNRNTVQTKLKRGRETLRKLLMEVRNHE